MINRKTVVSRVDNAKKWVALTFDIGWGSKMPLPVLFTLRKNKVNHATFFLSGPWVAKKTWLAKRIRSYGYEIGSHGYLHENYTKHSNRWIKSEVKKAETVIQSTIGIKTKLIRTPNGDINPRVASVLRSCGYNTIHWSIDSLDWTNPGIKNIIRNSTLKTRSGDIILLHASDSARQTASALPFIIRKLRSKGFKFVTVSRLLNQK